MGVIFDEDHDFEGLRSPRAHLDTKLSSTPSSLTLRRRSLRNRRLLRLGEVVSTLRAAAGQSAFHSRATRVAAATAIAASLMTWAPDSGGSCTGAGADGEGAVGGEGGGGARQTNFGPVGFVAPVFLAFLFSSSAISAASSYENVKSPSCVTACSGRAADGGDMASAACGGATRGS
eukprot:scaffold42493_cov68-Phaeocystis_antarctica.AAC.7